MSYRYNRRPTQPSPGSSQRPPTLEDYIKLAQEHKELKARLEEQSKALHNTKTELDITKDALHKQGEELKKLETELLFTRAGLEDAQKKQEAQDKAEAGDQSWQEKYVRLQADVENMRKRWDQRLATDTAEARHRILNDMLPLADHLDWAMEHTPKSDDAVVKNYIGSIEATRRAFLETLRRYGIERIGEAGEAFDPNWHEAVGQAAVPGVAADHVAQVVQAGYKEGERVIRPARVLVSAG